MRRFTKLSLWSLILFSVLGFRVMDIKWDISTSDPTLWIKLCEEQSSNSLPIENDFNGTDDPLAGVNTLTLNQVIQSVIDDYNNVPTSFVRLAFYPADPNNPGQPAQGDSVFTIEKAKKRTIDICFGNLDPRAGLSGGYALPKVEGLQMVGCEIRARESAIEKAKGLTHLLAHEVGHCLGLMHPQEGVNAIMSYFTPERRRQRLQGDDMSGLTFMYPSEASYAVESATLGLSGCAPKSSVGH